MQLIVETETNINIKAKMCDVDQGHLNDKEIFNNVPQDIKIENTCNGNKENIELQDNIITLITEEINITQNEKTVVKESTEKLDSNVGLEENTVSKENESMEDNIIHGFFHGSHKNIEQEEHENDIALNNVHALNSTEPMESENSTFLNENVKTETPTNSNEEVINQEKKTIAIESDTEDKEIKENEYKKIEEALSEMEGLSKKDDSESNVIDRNNAHFEDQTNKENGILTHKNHVDSGKDIENVDQRRKKSGDNNTEDVHIINKSENCITFKVEVDKNNENFTLENHESEEESKEIIKLEDEVHEISENCTVVKDPINDNSENCHILDTQLNDNIEDIVEKETLSDKNDDNSFEKQVCKDNNEDDTLENQGIEESGKVVTLKDQVDINSEEVESQREIVSLDEDSDVKENSSLPREERKLETSAESKRSNTSIIDCVDITEIDTNLDMKQLSDVSSENKDFAMDADEVTIIDDKKEEPVQTPKKSLDKQRSPSKITALCKLDNTMDILSDDDEDTPLPTKDAVMNTSDKQCINIEDDDDVMLIDEDMDNKTETEEEESESAKSENVPKPEPLEDCKKVDDNIESEVVTSEEPGSDEKEKEVDDSAVKPVIDEKTTDIHDEKLKTNKPLLPENFLKTCQKNFADMTREDLEEFCILKIVEGVVDRSNLSEIQTKLKNMSTNLEDYKKKVTMLTKQNRDLQVVLKSIQEEQKRANMPITPLKITRSVGMQVYMTEAPARRKVQSLGNSGVNRPGRIPPNQSPRAQKPSQTISQQIPVPRLVPAGSTTNTIKSPLTPQTNPMNNAGKASPVPNGIRNSPTSHKQAEKRPLSKVQTVDLTDDEPPAKLPTKCSSIPPVRVVPQQNLLAPRPPFPSNVTPRKVYIPISGPQAQGLRPGQTIAYKPMPAQRPRGPSMAPSMIRMQQNQVRMRVQGTRHPAPLPDVSKQYQPPNWKTLPPAPDLKLSKVENGIVISWKIENYVEENYEEIASYQLYAYQETSSPPSTALWKKIGDVKALPLPMACTLTQFMAGYKYYFAVRAVDVKSRLGPFSLPGSILLLNKM